MIQEQMGTGHQIHRDRPPLRPPALVGRAESTSWTHTGCLLRNLAVKPGLVVYS